LYIYLNIIRLFYNSIFSIKKKKEIRENSISKEKKNKMYEVVNKEEEKKSKEVQIKK
jgi:hypothetical protein